MKEVYLSILRNKETGAAGFRRASDQLAKLLCADTLVKLIGERITVETPVGVARGFRAPEDIMVAPILRSGLALLPAFLEALPDVIVGIVGLERDEKTAAARVYYQKFPKELPVKAIILDPMLATGGSACQAVDFLKCRGYNPNNIYFAGVIAAQEGFDRLAQAIPNVNITIVAIDPKLNSKKYIVPGLGDYGDRYFGT